MKIKLINGKKINYDYEEFLNFENELTKFYRKNYLQLYDTKHIMPAFFQNAYAGDLMEVELPESIEEIQGYAFNECINLKKIKLNNGLKIILNHAFKNCNSLKEIVIPNSVTNIQNGFYNCKELEKVIFDPHQYKEEIVREKIPIYEAIRDVSKFEPEYGNTYAFENCPKLREIDISNIPRIDIDAFVNCDNIKKIKFNVGKMQDKKATIDLDENEKFYSIQKEKNSIVVRTKINDKIVSRFIDIKNGKLTKHRVSLILNENGNPYQNFEYFQDIPDEALNVLPYLAVNGKEYFSTDNVYSSDDVKKIKLEITKIKKNVLANSKDLNQKEIYARMVTILSQKLEYDYLGVCIMLGANNRMGELAHEINACQAFTKMSYEQYVISKIGINPIDLFKDPNNLLKVYQIIMNYRKNSRTVRALITGTSICYSNPEIIRNIAHELGIETRCINGAGHSWNQVKLDGIWYDDDFTYYSNDIKNKKFDSKYIRENFLKGSSEIGGKKVRDFFMDNIHKFRATSYTGEDVGDSVNASESLKLLEDANISLNYNPNFGER